MSTEFYHLVILWESCTFYTNWYVQGLIDIGEKGWKKINTVNLIKTLTSLCRIKVKGLHNLKYRHKAKHLGHAGKEKNNWETDIGRLSLYGKYDMFINNTTEVAIINYVT